MNEARKLSEPTPADTPRVEPAVGLEPVPVMAVAVDEPPTTSTAPARPRKRRGRGFLNALLILSLVGLVAFGAGAALCYALLDGTLDLQTGWVKESLGTLKELAQHFK